MAFLKMCINGSFISSKIRLSARVSPPAITNSICFPCCRAKSRTIRGNKLKIVDKGNNRSVRTPSSSSSLIVSKRAISSEKVFLS